MLLGVGEERSLLPCLSAAGLHHLHLLSPVSPRILCSSLRHYSVLEEALNAAGCIYWWAVLAGCISQGSLKAQLWRGAMAWGVRLGTVMLRRALSTGITHTEQLYRSPARAQLSHPAHTDTKSPPASLGQVFLIYFQEAHHWQLGKGVSLPFDLWLCLKKMGCQNAPALKMKSAAATGIKMFGFTC